MKNLFRFKVAKDTGIAAVAGLLMIALSLLMIPFGGDSVRDTVISFILRDVLMIFGLGVVFVNLYVEKKGKEVIAELGFTKRKWILSLILNIVLGGGLLAVFLKDEVPVNVISLNNFYGASYILVAGIFEMTFIYGFLRMSFEKAFGIIPAILLTSVFWLNDLRTIADYLKDNTKLDMTIVFLSFFAVVCGIFFFMLKSCFKLVQKGDGRKQNVIVLSICSGLILAMVIISKVYISHIGEATEAERLGDKYALELIEESRTGDVYSVKYPSLYKSDYPYLSRSVMYSEDLARNSNVTVLVDKADELYVFSRRGYLYAQISENSAVYTNDDAVIKSLSEHGYTPKGYYPGTKTQGVGDKATGNDLRACEYDAVIKLDVGGNIPETGTVGGIIVEGEKNNVLIEKKEILTDDIDKSGESVVTIHFTLPSDTPNVRVKVNGFGGSEITVNSITIVPAPKYDIHKKFDKNMNLIEEKFYSIDGEPVLNDNGYSICRYEYDQKGKVVSTKYYDVSGNEVMS